MRAGEIMLSRLSGSTKMLLTVQVCGERGHERIRLG